MYQEKYKYCIPYEKMDKFYKKNPIFIKPIIKKVFNITPIRLKTNKTLFNRNALLHIILNYSTYSVKEISQEFDIDIKTLNEIKNNSYKEKYLFLEYMLYDFIAKQYTYTIHLQKINDFKNIFIHFKWNKNGKMTLKDYQYQTNIKFYYFLNFSI